MERWKRVNNKIRPDDEAEDDKETLNVVDEKEAFRFFDSYYIIITDRNYPTDGGKVVNWRDDNDTTRQYSHVILHDVIVPLTNI